VITATRLAADLAREFTGPGMWDGTLIDASLAAVASADPDRLAVVDRGRTFTYGELDRRIRRLAGALTVRGLVPGDVVSWMLPNWVEALITHHAALRIGAISNPIIPIYRHNETAFILRQAQSKIIVIPDRFRGFDYPSMLKEIRKDLPDLHTAVVVGSAANADIGFEDLVSEGGADFAPYAAREGNNCALLLYTSGTTSAPKGVLHTHNTLNYETRSVVDFYNLTRSDVVFMPSPVGHITGILYGLQLPFVLGTSVVLLDIWEPGRAIELISTHSCSFVVAATPFLHGIVHHPTLTVSNVTSLRVFACGGADVPPELIRTATSALSCTVSRGYGSSEFPTATGTNATDPLEMRATTDGRTIGAAQIRVNEAGELEVRGPEMFVGYLDDSVNAGAFTDDGWFRTGDLARLSPGGYVEITGRSKDIIIRGGENISAKEIEDHLFEHPLIADIGIVAYPDPILGERVCAVVVPSAGEAISLPAITHWLAARNIARQKLPEHLIVLDELPRTPSGKVQKYKLRELARTNAAALSSLASADHPRQKRKS
jgi:cyclohexanecarboxylate-CoA ligase